jgi:hypothetical protein
LSFDFALIRRPVSRFKVKSDADIESGSNAPVFRILANDRSAGKYGLGWHGHRGGAVLLVLRRRGSF